MRPIRARRRRRGAALLLAVLILIVLAAIVFQIFVATSTAARVGRNDVNLTMMEQATDSALLEIYDKLKLDGEAAEQGGGASDPAAGGTGGAGGAGADPTAGGAGGAGQEGQQQEACDSRKDEWAKPARTEINEIRLRILIQDEDSKVNVLSLLVKDEKEAKAAFERVVRVLDKCRDGTTADIDSRTAEDMAKAMLEYMTKGKQNEIPRATQLSDDPDNEDLKLPRSLREFQILQPFEPNHFRDFRDEHGVMVHSIESFLTAWSSVITAGDLPRPVKTTAGSSGSSGSNPSGSGSSAAGNKSGSAGSTSGGSNSGGTANQGTSGNQGNSGNQGGTSSQGGSGSGGSGSGGSGSGGNSSSGSGSGSSGSGSGSGSSTVDSGGWQVNVNTAPPAVLKSLFDDREVNPRFWDQVIEYRNLEEEKKEGESEEEPAEPVFDEYGQEVKERRAFESLSELDDVEGFKDLTSEVQGKVKQMLTTQSRVFSIFIVSRRATGAEDGSELASDPREMRLAEEKGDSLTRVVRSVVWRHKVEEELVITPLLRWETLDSVPHEVLDYPEDDR